MIRSIRVKLTLWYTCILALVFAAFSVATYTLILRVMQDEMGTNIAEMAGNFVTSVNQLQNEQPRTASPEKIISEALQDFQFHDYGFAVFDANGKVVIKTLDEDVPPEIDKTRSSFSELRIGSEPFAVVERSMRVGGRQYRLFVLYSLADQIAVEGRILNIFLVIAPVLLILAAAGGYFLARESLKPIAAMGDMAKKIGAANLHERLPVANPNDEIGDLAVLFNQLLDRLDEGFEKQRRFMADASHELRTPLAIIRGESEVTLQKEKRSDDEYRSSLKIVNDEGKRLSKIVEDLFTLARVDSGDIQANFREVYLDELVTDCVTKIRTLASDRGIAVTCRIEEIKVEGDEALLRRLFLNLLDNAVKYNRKNGTITITGEDNRIDVANTGDPIPDDQQSLIFERFYRIDKAHSRNSSTLMSGAGLGLSIAKWIADIHHADLIFSRSESGENIFSVVFTR